MSLLIKNGEIITADSRYIADIYCEGDTVTRIDRNIEAPPGTEVIDATGKYIFPGFIDPHVHIYLPFMGTYAKDTYETASQAALLGGTTTLIEMACPARSDDTLEGFHTWLAQAEGRSACDFTFHMGVTKFEDQTEAQLREIVAAGISSFKIFLAYKGAFGIDDTELYRTLKLAAELGVIVTAHCENETLVTERCKELLAAGLTDPGQHHESRPPIVEAEGVHHLLTFAELTGAETYIVHLSCKEALANAIAARQRGVKVSVETLIQYLVLDKTYAELPDFEGAKYVMSPPLRDKTNQDILWNGLRDGLIQSVATDHAPFDFADQKHMGENDFTKIPNGIPSLEERIHLLYTHGVKSGRIDLHTMVAIASTNIAKLFGLFPRKGCIQPGADADLVIFDPNHSGTISAKTQHMNVDYSAFEGWPLHGRSDTVTVRGQVAVKNGKFVGNPTRGEFLKRPTRS
ncbi:dihydropyrimidinase [Phragmitibacter flavus]|uniref:Dihydropyrimidinase n=1 Tax=Phragmitibacter flavus TaxID=2576071 RepID=A0A5R8KH01_9BACT|nr:dihydropyrimidinase [Phragmitibacter flavus]TLD71586.1 dihydropyrimidinase [Phragmitibacter flavus]